MAVALRKHDDDFDDQPMSDMNVTPLVDVMLVLLIIFMVAAPLMASGVPIDLPKSQAKQLNDQKPPLGVSVDATGHYFIDATEFPAEQLLPALINQAENQLDRRIHVRADKDLPYHVVLEVMGKINAAGFTKVALVAQNTAPATPGAPAAKGPADGQPAAGTAPQVAPIAQVAPVAQAAPVK